MVEPDDSPGERRAGVIRNGVISGRHRDLARRRSSTGASPRSFRPSIGKTSVDRTAAPTSDAAVVACMCPVSRASVVIASTSGSWVEVNSASETRSRRSRMSP